MIQFLLSWAQHGWHPGHLFELAFLVSPWVWVGLRYVARRKEKSA